LAKKRTRRNAAPSGRKGPTGARGLRGVRGLRGRRGRTGLRGAPGARGKRGPSGLQGRRGKVGATGARGKKGATGPAEHSRLIEIVKSVEERFDDVYRQLDIQLKRIAQLQADFDALRGAWDKSKLPM
jgi:hypothetical protein